MNEDEVAEPPKKKVHKTKEKVDAKVEKKIEKKTEKKIEKKTEKKQAAAATPKKSESASSSAKKRTADKATKPKAAKPETPTKAVKDPKAAILQSKDPYVASSKYVGSKKGYVFTKGKLGLGYYIDRKPQVDRMAIEAIVRAASQGKGKKQGGRKGACGQKRKGRR